jgi:uncharacterized protein
LLSSVEDRRGSGVPRRGIALSGGGILLVVVLALVTGQEPLQLLTAVSGPSVSVDTGQGEQGGAPSDELGKFAATVLGSTEDVWARVLPSSGHQYERPTLVLFTGAVQSACGFSSAAHQTRPVRAD